MSQLSRTVATVFVSEEEELKTLRALMKQAEGIVDHRVDLMGLRHMEESRQCGRKLTITIELEED